MKFLKLLLSHLQHSCLCLGTRRKKTRTDIHIRWFDGMMRFILKLLFGTFDCPTSYFIVHDTEYFRGNSIAEKLDDFFGMG